MKTPLCVMLPEIGIVSETFLRWDVRKLAPGRTAVIADPPPAGQSLSTPPDWDTGDAPTLTFDPVPGDPPPDAQRQAAVADFIYRHGVGVVLVEFLDFADRWFDLLTTLGVRVWLRGHGVDFSARIRERRWRDAYHRYATADGLIVPSHAAASLLVDAGLPASKVHVVRYCVDIPPPRAATSRQNEIRCVAVGRLVPKKAPLLLLDAFRRAATSNPHLTLDVVGDGPLAPEVRAYVDRHQIANRVRLHGRQPHDRALSLTRGADILLHHAMVSDNGDTEGQPLAILEAMAAGLPVVATHHAGIPEVITDGVNGRLVRERDVTAMAAALLELADNPSLRQQLGTAARDSLHREHTHTAARRRLTALLGIGATDA